MEGWRLDRLSLAAGLWQGRLTGPEGAEPPPLAATCAGIELAAPRIEPAGAGRWTVGLALPPAIMTDGTQVLAIGPAGGDPFCLDRLAFGDALAGDLAAELAALRVEVEVLKRALRRHLAGGD
jgi:hypothetical protein